MTKLYKYTLLFLIIIFSGCYNDDNQIVEALDASHNSSELTSVLKSITSHDASFDDQVDNTSCFSLVFPYQLKVNSNIKTFTSAEELSYLDVSDEIEILYPVSIALKNYQIFEVNSTSELNSHKLSCERSLDIEPNSCVDLVYNLTIKQFNEIHGVFKTFDLTNNKEAFMYFEELHDNDVYEIQYPILLQDRNSENTTVNSNSEFINTFQSVVRNCD
ncbi:hypothetical protein [Psychroflexus lacisalsi]|jgi:hypothetical protein|uniref:Lipoprotein n=1 Tax=Psychroflexus lacisalsi TaxID=503928 RepID=A0ABN1K4I0_9FLAO|nr:hypothetical protein [Psychroflexus lacisalsi]MBZ9618957.1 hypothetical protein [Psychroflexus lacisalsi]